MDLKSRDQIRPNPHTGSASDRRTVLRLYDLDGDPNEILINDLSYDLDGNRIEGQITRSEFKSLISRIQADQNLVELIVSTARAEALNYLSGAEEPLQRGYPHFQDMYDHFCQAVAVPSHSLFACVIHTINCQIFYLVAEEADYEGLGEIELQNVKPKVMAFHNPETEA